MILKIGISNSTRPSSRSQRPTFTPVIALSLDAAPNTTLNNNITNNGIATINSNVFVSLNEILKSFLTSSSSFILRYPSQLSQTLPPSSFHIFSLTQQAYPQQQPHPPSKSQYDRTTSQPHPNNAYKTTPSSHPSDCYPPRTIIPFSTQDQHQR